MTASSTNIERCWRGALREAFLLELKNHDAIAAEIWRGKRKLPDPDDLPFWKRPRMKHFPTNARENVLVLSPEQAWAPIGAARLN